MKKILVVDNNPVVTKFITNRLEKEGYQVRSAETGLSALNILKSFIPDVIFIDLVMPNISGEKLCQIIRNTPELKSVFIVVISGIAREQEIDFSELGADACIAKGPFNKFAENIFYVLDRLQAKNLCDISDKVIGVDDLYEREATKELLSSRKHFEVILSNISDGILELTQKAKVVYANPAAVSLIGLAETKLLASNFIELFHRESDRKRIRDMLDRIEEGPWTITEDEPVLYNSRQFTLQISPVIDKVSDALIIIMRDITEIKCAHRALQESEEKYRKLYEEAKRAEEVYHSLLNSSADAIVIYDIQGQTHYVSSAFTEIFGWELGEVKGEKMPFLPESEKEATLSIIKDLVEKGTPCQGFETKRYTKAGCLLDVSISASRYDDHNGNPSGILVTIRDISEKKRLEAQLRYAQKIEAIGTLAGGIAHDFNNLLMGMLGNISLTLLEMNASNPHYEKIRAIEKYIQSGSKLTKQLLGYARKGRYEVKPIRLNEIVGQSAETFGRTRKDITIHLKLHEDLFSVEADQGQVEQVLLNIYVNAADAMPGGGDLILKTENITDKEMKDTPHCPKAGNFALLTVTDTGIGMDEKTLERIFDPFFTTKGMGRGTGLGMASVYGIIKAHGGYIDVKSKKGQGSTFYIYLPATDKKVYKKKEPYVPIEMRNGTILIVDDEEMILDVGVRMLEKLGYTVFSANNGREAIKIYEDNRNNTDLIILDMVMPGMSGSDVYDTIKKIDPDVKVLLSSGYSIFGSAKEIIERGCNGFIQKPYNLPELSKKINGVLENRIGTLSN